MHLRRFLFTLFALALAPPGFAQSLAKTFTLSAANQCAPIGTAQLPTVGIDVSGTFSLTLTPYVVINGQTKRASQVTPSNSNTAQATITSAGGYTDPFVGGYDTFLLCVTTYSSGSVVIWLNPSPALNGSLFSGGGGGGPPSGAAGGNLAGTYPNPGFAATQTYPNTTTLNPTSGSTLTLTSPDTLLITDSTTGAELSLSAGATLTGSAAFSNGVTLNGVGFGVIVSDNITAIGGAPAGFGTGTTGPGVPVQGNITRLVAQVAGFASTTVFTAPNAGAYRIQASVYCDSSHSTATATATVTYQDISGTTQSVTGTGAACTTLGAASFQQINIPLATLESGALVKWAVAIASTPTYDATIQVEQLSFN